MPRVVLYGDVNLNIMDGSAIWLMSMAEALSASGCEVIVPLKAKVKTDRLSGRLATLPNVQVIAAKPTRGREALIRSEVRDVVESQIKKNDVDLVIARGIDVCQKFVESEVISERLWAYITEYHYPIWEMDPHRIDVLHEICGSAQRVFAQTEDARAHLESTIPEAAGKTLLLTPMVPDEFFVDLDARAPRAADQPLRLVYSGKFAKEWLTLEAPELVEALQNEGVEATLSMVGDKFQKAPGDPEWPSLMRAMAEIPPAGVTFEGGVSREVSRELISRADIGLSWRSAALDQSVEISTKLLEYSAAGIPPLLNRTEAHERIFGTDYPLFIGPADRTVAGTARIVARAADSVDELRKHVQDVVAPYRLSHRARIIRGYIDRFMGSYLELDDNRTNHSKKHKVLVASHDLKFAGELLDMLKGRPDVDLKIDHWETLHKNNEAESSKLLDWAETIFCEWAGPNVVWYSNHKKPQQRLITRLHGFEVRNNAPWLPKINFNNVDQVVTVSELYKNMTAEVAQWYAEKITAIPNALDAADLGRSKQSGSEFRIGLVGIVPWLKRPDRAVEVLRLLLQSDPRFTLHIKGRMPWDYAHEWNKEQQRLDYGRFFESLGQNPDVAERVVFEPFGADIANWLTKIGFVLSPSTAESFHLAPAEGMASGAVPIFWEREGVQEIFGDQFLIADETEAAQLILDLARDPQRYQLAAEQACNYSQRFDIESVNKQWQAVLFPQA